MKSTFSSAIENDYGISDVSPAEVFEKREQVHIVDVRRPDEWVGELGHIEGSKLMTLDELPESIVALPKDHTYVFVCRSGGRSTRAAQIAQSFGVNDVFNMQGGMLLWNQLGLQIAK